MLVTVVSDQIRTVKDLRAFSEYLGFLCAPDDAEVSGLVFGEIQVEWAKGSHA